MKLRFDNNLSPKLVVELKAHYPESAYARDLRLHEASDDVVWEYARLRGFVIVSKDSDFRQRSPVEGFPPKVVWIQRGNCPTSAIIALLREHVTALQQFEEDAVAAFLVLE